MLPDYLSSSYARYKEDTHTIASWLANTAAQHGYKDGSSVKPVEVKKPAQGRLKGKARKEAKAAGAIPPPCATQVSLLNQNCPVR